MTTDKQLEPWGDDVALMGPDAPKWTGQIEHLICYLLTVHKRFGNTAVTAGLQWGASALWKRDEQKARIVQLEIELNDANDELADCGTKLAQKDMEIERLNKWADGFSGALIKERMACDELIKELRKVIADSGVQITALTNDIDAAKKEAKDKIARWFETRAAEYANEHGSEDPETGVLEFDARGIKQDYYNELIENADAIRAMES